MRFLFFPHVDNLFQVERIRQASHDLRRLYAQPNNPPDCLDQTVRIRKPPVGIIDHAAFLVLRDPVAIHEPFQGRPSIDLAAVRFRRNAGESDMVVDYEDGFLAVHEPHRSLPDPVVLQTRFSRPLEQDLKRVFLASFVAKMQFGQPFSGFRKRFEICRQRYSRQVLGQIVRETISIHR